MKKTPIYFNAVFEGTHQDEWNRLYFTLGNLELDESVTTIIDLHSHNDQWNLVTRVELTSNYKPEVRRPSFSPQPKWVLPLQYPEEHIAIVEDLAGYIGINCGPEVVNGPLKPDPYGRVGPWYRQRSVMLRDGRVFLFQHADESYIKTAIPILISSGKELFGFEFEPSLLDKILEWWYKKR